MSDVVVWMVFSRFVQVTRSRVLPLISRGSNWKLTMFTVQSVALTGDVEASTRMSAGSSERTMARMPPSVFAMNQATAHTAMVALRDALEPRGIALDAAQLERFERYGALLREWNERVNLTAITAPEEIVRKHFLDSLTLLLARPVRPSAEVIDVGTGAGFPGLPLAIARQDARVTLVESVAKKVRFLEAVIAALALPNVEVVQDRAEELAHAPERREHYDVAVARALPDLAANLELLLPFCRVGGEAVAYKGRVDDELGSAERAAAALGGELVEVISTASLGLGELLPGRRLVVVLKRKRTPARFPRRAAELKRRPWLGVREGPQTQSR